MYFSHLEILGNGGGDMKNKLIKLMEKEGFILFLFVCVCVIAGGTLFLSMRNINANKDVGNRDFVIVEEDEKKEVEKSKDYDENLYTINVSNSDVDAPVDVSNLEDVKEADSLEEDHAKEENEDDYAKVEVEDLEFEEDEYEEKVKDSDLVQETTKISLPVDGPILTEYTSDSLIYSETLEAWVGHEGIDIEAPEGTVVKAAADGVIKEVYEDELWGIVILIDHGGDLQTRYSNLATKDMVKVNLKVKKGDSISKVGNTAKIEMMMKPHLHFEVIKNGKLVNPRSINN